MEVCKRLIVELSNICNLKCDICFIQQDVNIKDKSFLSFDTFKNLSEIFPHLESLVFSGFGEPLLHPYINEFVKFAKDRMPKKSDISVQTNGFLLKKDNARKLIESGLKNFCLSVDRIEGGLNCHSLENAKEALHVLSSLKKDYGNFKFGVEVVLSKENLDELIQILNVLISLKIDYLIVSHLIPYSQYLSQKVAFDTNNEDSVNIFNKWSKVLKDKGYNLLDWIELSKKMAGENVGFNREVYEIYKEMYNESESKGLTLNLKKLMERDNFFLLTVQEVLEEVKDISLRNGIAVKLPGVHPRSKRACDFIEKGCMFISVDGDVSPCYFLWHSFNCYIGGLKKSVRKLSFGNINLKNPLDIYNDRVYKKFRETVLKYEFPYCYDCNFALCDLMELEDFMYDCYSNEIPCGACLWCGDLFYCLI
ncbi:MAG: radical SAM/SPASM family putative metalloenzyme maturase [Proteobacteria bacterium]|nr:radical SAM/SPASM family putative metalloenzyme maturase [Pseudomonadota bacterium]